MNKILLLLLVSTVGLGLMSLHLVRELRTERENSRALQTRFQAFQDMTTRLQAPRRVVPMEPAAVPPPSSAQFIAVARPPVATPTASASGAAAAQAPSREDSARWIRENIERQRALLQNPEYREAMKAQQKMMLARTYSDLDKELELDPEQFDQLLSLLTDQQLRQMENQPVGDELANRASAEDFQRRMQQQQQANDAELVAMLGGEKFRAWKDYQSTMGVRHQVTQLRSTLSASGTPLDQDQIKPLLKAMASEQQRQMKEYQKEAQKEGQRRGSMQSAITFAEPSVNQLQWQEQNLQRMAQHNKRMRDAVAPILTAEQLRHFEREQNEQLRMQEVQMRMMRAQAEAAARGDIPSPNAQGLWVPADPTVTSSVSPR